MDAARYRTELARILDAAAPDVAARLARLAAAAQEGVRIDVCVDQDGEGPFDLWARFDGPGAFALDRRFDDDRHLFGVEWGEEGWEPDVPPRPRGWSRDELEAKIVDLVAEWLVPLLPSTPLVTWEVGSPDGTLDARTLVPARG